MIIDGHKIAKVEITDPEGEVVAVLEDEGATKKPGFKVNVYLDMRPGPDAIVRKDDILYYKNEDRTKYLVVQADEKFFMMVPTIINKETSDVKLDFDHPRTYPNNRKVGSLSDFGLVLDYRGEDEDEKNQSRRTRD